MATPSKSTVDLGLDRRAPELRAATRWDAETATQAVAAAAKNDLANGTGPSPGAVVTGSRRSEGAYTWPAPKPKFGYPGAAKGAIYALDPIDHSRGDALFFSRYPEFLNEKIESALASDSTPGRAYPAFQKMGAKGLSLSVELWFCDAFLWSSKPTDPLDGIVGNRKVSLAEQARQFFKAYMIGHDGTGVAVPPADLYLHWGGAENAVPIVINSVQLKSEMFTSTDLKSRRFLADAPGVPQLVSASVEMQVYIPLTVIDPFRPKRVIPPVRKKPLQTMCGGVGKDETGREYIDIGGVKYFKDSPPAPQPTFSSATGGSGGGGLPYTDAP